MFKLKRCKELKTRITACRLEEWNVPCKDPEPDSHYKFNYLKSLISAAGAVSPLPGSGRGPDGAPAVHPQAEHRPRHQAGPASHRDQRERRHRAGREGPRQAQEQQLHHGQQPDAGRGV